MPPELLETDRIQSIVGAFYTVYNYFGYGLAEAVYAAALESELTSLGHTVVRELAISVRYRGRHVAWQRLDMVVDDRVVVEAKATPALPPFAERQLLNYLRASSFQVGLLLHFGPEPKFKKLVDSHKAKPSFGVIRANPRHPRPFELEPTSDDSNQVERG